MTPEEYDALPGIERLRRADRAFSYVSEEFLTRFTVAELLAIHRAWALCEWKFYPDQWTPKQLRGALEGKIPQFDNEGKPL